MAHSDKLAVNPLPWVIGENGFTLNAQVLGAAMEELADAGFDAIHADIPEGWSAKQYLEFIGEHGFRPAPGYFAADFSDPTTHANIAEQAKQHAAKLAELGLTESFSASNLTADRMAHPAQGYGTDSARTVIVADGLAAAAEAAKAEGITHALHPHVGSDVEVEAEVRQVLDATAGSALAFGPDTGHLTWAGMSAAALIAGYADRVVALHLKDVDLDAAKTARAAETDYFTATNQHHVWTEPGRGSVNFDLVLAALPTSFDGWSVVEVDVPNLPTAKESATVSRQNLLALSFYSDGAHA